MALAWKIWYDGGASYYGDPWEAPAFGVQVVVLADAENGRAMRMNHDYYWYLPGSDTWEGGDIVGLIDYLAQRGPRKVVFGRIVPNADFRATYQLALDDLDFAPKTAHAYRERVIV